MLHVGESHIDDELVRHLIAAQFPHWRGLAIEQVRSTGTVNAIFRLGAGLCVRLPRIPAWADGVAKEVEWLPQLAPHLSLAVPEPVALGRPAAGYPSVWAIYRWVPGEPFTRRGASGEGEAAEDLARFVAELQLIETAGAPRSTRVDPIGQRDSETKEAIEALHGVIDTHAVSAVWEASVGAPRRDGDPVWTHGDLLPSNVLVVDGSISAVIDFGGVGVGDSAIDLIPAWTMFGRDGRRVFRDSLRVDDAGWARARGLALHQALLIMPYYRETNPEFVAMAKQTIEEVTADDGS